MFKDDPMILNYSCSVSKETLSAQFSGKKLSSHYRTSYNVHPGQNGWLMTSENEGRIVPALWGYPDHDDDKGEKIKTFMAEGSSVATSPTFRMSIRQRRCLVIADSYYVQRIRGDKKQVHRIFSRDMPLLLMAGVYERRVVHGKEVICYNIIQTDAGADIKDLYHKMPLIIAEDEVSGWLDRETPIQDVLKMIRPMARYSLQYYQITNQVTDRKFNHSEAHSRKHEHLTLFDQ